MTSPESLPPIPFNRPSRTGNEDRYMAEALAAGHISGDGAFTRRCHELLREALGAPAVLLTTSCTSALEMAALLLEIRPGDEVIVPSFTFVSSVNAFVLRGARPVFADIRPDTLNLDERHLASLVTERTRAVVPVHYAGVGCDMDAIDAITRPRGIAVVEDNAHGLFGRYKGRLLGSFGALSTLSFHETKNFTCGEGGALVINDPALVERAEIIREKGTNRSRFFRGQVDKYTWVDVGSSYLPSDLLAAYLLAQLESKDRIQSHRQKVYEHYRGRLAEWAAASGARLPFVPEWCATSYHMFYVLMPDLAARQALIAHLKQRGILAVFHYLPLHRSPAGVKYGKEGASCPVTDDASDRLVRLPFYNDLGDDDLARIVDAVAAFRA